MKKVIFGGFCMLSALFGIFIILYLACVNPLNELTITYLEKGFLDLIEMKGYLPAFYVFCCLGLSGLLIGVWGVFENDSK